MQRDSDADGVNDRDDLCPDSTHSNIPAFVVTPEQADEDNDGVADNINCSQTKATEQPTNTAAPVNKATQMETASPACMTHVRILPFLIGQQ